MIKEIKPDMDVALDFMLGDVTVSDTKNGKKMLRVDLLDMTGKIGAVMWDYQPNTRGTQLLKAGAIVHIHGSSSEYQGKLQLVINSVSERVTKSDENFEKVSKYPVTDMWYEFLQYVHGFESPIIKSVVADLVLKDDVIARFCKSPAATGMHHAFKGGLLEHTLQMLQSGDALLKLPCYKEALNRDLCLFGLMFHDFSKMYEYNPDAGFKKTQHGVLIGHIAKTACLIEVSCEKLGVPEEVRDHLQHMVLAHHGKVAWGSPVDMATPEAMFVHYVDNLHGTVFGVLQKIDADANAEYVKRWDDGRNINVLTKRFSETLAKYES